MDSRSLEYERLRERALLLTLSLGRRTLILTLFLMVLAVLGKILGFLQQIHVVATITSVAILSAYVISPAVNRLQTRARLPRIVAISTVYICLGLVGGLALAYIIPVVKQQYTAFSHHFGSYLAGFQHSIRDLIVQLQTNGPAFVSDALKDVDADALDLASLFGDLQNAAPAIVGGTLPGVFTGFKAAAVFLAGMILVPLFTFYILMDPERYSLGFLRLVPRRWKPDVQEVITEIDLVLGRYIRGQLLVCFTVGTLVALVLNLLRLEYATLIGVFVGMVDIIPYIGVPLGLIPAVLIAVCNHGVGGAVAVWAAMQVIHWSEGHIIVPAVVGRSVGLPPLLVIVALGAGAELGGLLGMVFAIPVAAILRVLTNFYIRRLERSDPIVIVSGQELVAASANGEAGSESHPIVHPHGPFEGQEGDGQSGPTPEASVTVS
jgi:predicted PurR-regulated permease PerM